jgi:hypothetical protein
MTWIFFGWMVSRFFVLDIATTTDPDAGWTLDGGSGQPPQSLDGGSGQPPQQLDGGSGQPPSRL